MKDNVDKVLERDANLCQLQNRAGIIDQRKKQIVFSNDFI
jgi:hypothetical protein